MAEKPNPVEILETVEALTVEQLNDTLDAVKAEELYITDHGDRNVANTRRLRELRSYRNVITSTINEINAPVDEVVEVQVAAEEPVAEEVTEEAPVIETVESVEKAVELIESNEEVVMEQTPSTQEVVELVMAALAEKSEGPAATADSGAEVVAEEVAETPTSVITANLGGFRFNENNASATPGPVATFEDVAPRVNELFRNAQTVSSEDTQYIMRKNVMAGLGAERLGEDADANDRIMAESKDLQLPIQASLDCCSPNVDTAGGVCVDASRPVADMFGNRVAVGCGKFAWHKNWSLGDLDDTAASVWFKENQALVDPDDKSTWKPCASLPGCDDTCEATAHWLYGCLKISVEDEMSRPNRIADAASLVEADLARQGDAQLLSTIDFYSNLYAIDLAAEYLGEVGTVPYGIAAVLPAIASRVLRLVGVNRRVVSDNYSAIVPESLVHDVAADIALAGANPAQATVLIRDIFSRVGINSVVITPDWACEGPVGVDEIKEPDTCKLNPGDLACATSTFATGEALPTSGSQARIRIVNAEDFVFGQTGIIDFQVRRSPELISQNCAVWQGETAEILFKRGSCSPSFSIDIDNYCVNGARAGGVVPFAC